MKLRKFFQRALGLSPAQPARSHPVDPLDQAFHDASILIAAIFAGEPWSRRAFHRRMSQPRWQAATKLLRQADILDRNGRFTYSPYIGDGETAMVFLRQVYREEKQRRSQRNYVSPFGKER